MVLPLFRYHPDPISTGSIKPSHEPCVCCGKNTGFKYTAALHGRHRPGRVACVPGVLPAVRLRLSSIVFSDESPLVRAGMPRAIVLEVSRRTPCYNCWQQDVWAACCQDGCVFHGDASVSELLSLKGEELAEVQREWSISSIRRAAFVKQYVPGGGIAVYRFDCRHCGKTRYGLDLS